MILTLILIISNIIIFD